jgi:hypothetical protein
LALPTTLLWKHPTIHALGAHLLSLLGLAEAASPAPNVVAEDASIAAAVEEVRGMSDAEAEALLLKKLESL